MATLDDVDDALYAALADLQRDAAHPERLFAAVARFTGQVQMTPGGITLQREAVGALPAVLWQWVGEDVSSEVETLMGERDDVGTVQWVAWVLMQDTRGARRQMKGATGTPGVHALNDAVIAALNGVASDDLFHEHRVRYARARAFLAERGVHITQITVVAQRAVDGIVPTVESDPLVEIDGNVNQPFTASDDNPDNPRVAFVSDTTDD